MNIWIAVLLSYPVSFALPYLCTRYLFMPAPWSKFYGHPDLCGYIFVFSVLGAGSFADALTEMAVSPKLQTAVALIIQVLAGFIALGGVWLGLRGNFMAAERERWDAHIPVHKTDD